jgi:hypothetical protein
MKGLFSVIVLFLLATAVGSFGEWGFASESDLSEIESDQTERYVTGMVYNAMDGGTFNVTDFGRVWLADDGFTVVPDYKDNEFDPLDWWPSLRQVVIGEVELNPAGDDNDGQVWFLTDEGVPEWRYGWP